MTATLDIDDETLEELALDLESDLVERKESASSRDKIAQAICAFANDLPGHGRPGVVFVGLRDNGTYANIRIDDRLLLNLGAIRSDGNILPPPTMTVSRRQLGMGEVAVVIVRPSNDPPVRYSGRVWVRVGPRRAIATRDEERILAERRRSLDLPFDQRTVRGAQIDALDLDRIERDYIPRAVAADVLAENSRSLDHQLAALHLLSPEGSPTAAALLLFCPDPCQWLPGAYVQFVRFDGVEMTDPIANQAEISGPIPDVIVQIDHIIRANIRIESEVGTHTIERRRPDYAEAALQQLLRNAVMHRTYESTHAPVQWYWFSDRVEIRSPGGLFGRVTPENFGKPGATDYRNPAIAAAMKGLGFVQRFGMGIPLAKRSCLDIGSPPPEFDHQSSTEVAILRARCRDRSVVLATRGGVQRPERVSSIEDLYLPKEAGAELERRLRASPPDREAWSSAMAEVERGVQMLAQRTTGGINVFVQAPYPLAAWLGRCLDEYARAREVLLYQWLASGRWVALGGPDSKAQTSGASFFQELRRVADRTQGSGVVVAVAGRQAPSDDQLERVAHQAGARWIYRLDELPAAQLEDESLAPNQLRAALIQQRAALTQLRQVHPGEPLHIVLSVPVTLAVELGRQLSPTSTGSVTIYAYTPVEQSHHAVVDISSGMIVHSPDNR